MRQLEHNETNNASIKSSIVVVSEDIRTPENIGMMLRVAESFGIDEVYICGDSPDLNNKKVRKTSRSTENQIKVVFCHSIESTMAQLKTMDYRFIALELTTVSKDIRSYELGQNQKTALFVGSERNGITAKTLAQMDDAVYIPMKGQNSSINVVNALAIGLYELTNKLEA